MGQLETKIESWFHFIKFKWGKLLSFIPENMSNYNFENFKIWFDQHSNWFSDEWKVQSLSVNTYENEWEAVFIHVCPYRFANEAGEFDKLSTFNEKNLRFIQKKISWQSVEALLEYVLSPDSTASHQISEGISFQKDQSQPFRFQNKTEYHSNISKCPFIPYFYFHSQMSVTGLSINDYILYEGSLYHNKKDAIMDIFLKSMKIQDQYFSNNFHESSLIVSFPLMFFKLNILEFDSRELIVNYSANSSVFQKIAISTNPFDSKPHTIQEILPDENNSILLDPVNHFKFSIIELNQESDPVRLLFSGRVGITEKELEKIDLSKVDEDFILELCKRGESQNLEFKDAEILRKKNRKHLLLEIEAFANTNTGVLLIGVGDKADDKGKILGIGEIQRSLQKSETELLKLVTEELIKSLDPTPIIEGKIVEVPSIQDKILVLKITFDNTRTPIVYDGKIVTRINSSLHPASSSVITRLTRR